MLFHQGRLARHFANWKAVIATKRSIVHVDDRLREDAGLPKRDRDPRNEIALRFPHLDL